jgi:hypothetical protein
LIQAEKHALVGIAKDKVGRSEYTEIMADLFRGGKTDTMNQRNVVVPSLLKTYCNMVELHRLRSEIILTASECAILQQTYEAQC